MWNSRHDRQHDRLEQRHDDVHDQLEDEHEDAHAWGLSSREHRRRGDPRGPVSDSPRHGRRVRSHEPHRRTDDWRHAYRAAAVDAGAAGGLSAAAEAWPLGSSSRAGCRPFYRVTGAGSVTSNGSLEAPRRPHAPPASTDADSAVLYRIFLRPSGRVETRRHAGPPGCLTFSAGTAQQAFKVAMQFSIFDKGRAP